MQPTNDVLPERSWYHHPGPIHDELIGDPKVVADCKKWIERVIDPAFVRWKAVLNRFPKLSVVRVPVSFLLEPCNVRVLQEGVDLVSRSGVLVSLEQHRVGVCWGLEVGFFINRVWECSWPGSVGWSAPEPPVRRLPAVGLPRRMLTWATAMTGWGSTSPSGAVRKPETVGRDHRRSGCLCD